MSKVKDLESRLSLLDQKLNAARTNPPAAAARTPPRDLVLGSPHDSRAPSVRKGESSLTSRGFQFQRLFGLMSKTLQPEHCKVELDVCERLRLQNLHESGWKPTPGAVQAPFATDFMGSLQDEQFRYEMKSLTMAGVESFDPHEADWIRRKAYSGYAQKADMSWVDESIGGPLVAPPAFGELITLLRNKSACIAAGARTVPLPPSGRIRYPRQTSPDTGYWLGENAAVTESQIGTGSLTLSAKKVVSLVTLPNELIRFANPASEALTRDSMTKTLSLVFDKGCLEGVGSDTTPLGIINTPGVATVTPTTVAAAGDTLAPQDLYLFQSAVEENNAEFTGWVLRPQLFYKLVQARAATNGQFVYDQHRQLGQGFPKILGGYPAVTTNQVSITRTKGGGVDLTYVLGGQWDLCIIAMFGSIEFATTGLSDSTFTQDQTMIRAILTGDSGLSHPGAFALCDNLVRSVSA